ncbi:hypothetical protein BGM19_17775 [Streptomyces agglomeratus]|uniref:DUF3263 domain-containing protein n=1 Tax=Streptomyces agglomeratus TaxID=285458 RepID=A0A1E5PJ00_9ACTN|nr:hypothetical protein AS594_19180 [Streptomyces agglomeratus]OEJ63141.1 hypothetical protein BGM19_17775 [Streptomyces agglomeratus]
MSSESPASSEPAELSESAELSEPAEPSARSGLSERDRAVLAVERRSWPGPGAKERAVREQLGISPTRYYQLLNALLDDPRAVALDPVTVNRLRRVRDARRERR